MELVYRVPGNAHPPGAQTCTILAFALLARLLILWFAIAQFGPTWLFTRGIELGTLAQSLLAGQGLSSPFGGSTGPTALLAPGYPAIIACIFRVFGSFTFAAAIAVMVAASSVQCGDRVDDHACCAAMLRRRARPTWLEHFGRYRCRSSGCRRSSGRPPYPRCFWWACSRWLCAVSDRPEGLPLGWMGVYSGSGSAGESCTAAASAVDPGLGGLADARKTRINVGIQVGI